MKQENLELLQGVFGKPPKEIEDTIQKLKEWRQQGLPPATDPKVLYSRCNW